MFAIEATYTCLFLVCLERSNGPRHVSRPSSYEAGTAIAQVRAREADVVTTMTGGQVDFSADLTLLGASSLSGVARVDRCDSYLSSLKPGQKTRASWVSHKCCPPVTMTVRGCSMLPPFHYSVGNALVAALFRYRLGCEWPSGLETRPQRTRSSVQGVRREWQLNRLEKY